MYSRYACRWSVYSVVVQRRLHVGPPLLLALIGQKMSYLHGMKQCTAGSTAGVYGRLCVGQGAEPWCTTPSVVGVVRNVPRRRWSCRCPLRYCRLPRLLDWPTATLYIISQTVRKVYGREDCTAGVQQECTAGQGCTNSVRQVYGRSVSVGVRQVYGRCLCVCRCTAVYGSVRVYTVYGSV